MSFVNAGAHLVPSAFSIRFDPEEIRIRARITIDARPATAIELLASTLGPQSLDGSEAFPAYADVLALRNAVSG